MSVTIGNQSRPFRGESSHDWPVSRERDDAESWFERTMFSGLGGEPINRPHNKDKNRNQSNAKHR